MPTACSRALGQRDLAREQAPLEIARRHAIAARRIADQLVAAGAAVAEQRQPGALVAIERAPPRRDVRRRLGRDAHHVRGQRRAQLLGRQRHALPAAPGAHAQRDRVLVEALGAALRALRVRRDDVVGEPFDRRRLAERQVRRGRPEAAAALRSSRRSGCAWPGGAARRRGRRRGRRRRCRATAARRPRCSGPARGCRRAARRARRASAVPARRRRPSPSPCPPATKLSVSLSRSAVTKRPPGSAATADGFAPTSTTAAPVRSPPRRDQQVVAARADDRDRRCHRRSPRPPAR